MIIRKVSLENIKSYKAAEIDFAEGITGIAGLNGSGKSTVLEAIGYAIFDSQPYKQDEFVRNGEKTGRVAVTFTGADGTDYTVTRKCGASQAYFIENGLGIRLEGKADVGHMLCDVLGYKVNELDQLKALFENAVGVLQGTFVSEFLENPRNRKTIFDPLLRVEEYNTAAKNMLPLKNLVESRINAMDGDRRQLEGRVERLEPLKEEKKKLDDEDSDLARQTEEKKRVLEETRVKKDALEAAEKVVRDLEGQHRVATSEHAGALREMETARLQWESAEKAEQRLKESEPGFKVYLAKQEEKEALDKKRTERDAVLKSIYELKNQLERLKAGDEACDRTLNEIVQARKELPALEQKAAELERLDEEKAKIASLLSAKDMELAQVRERMARAKGSQGNLCPVLLGVECTSIKDFSIYFNDQIKRIQDERSGLQVKANEITFKIKALGNPKIELEVRRETVKKGEKATAEKDGITTEITAKNAVLFPLIMKLSGFESLDKAMEKINVEIKGLKPVYEAYQQNMQLAGEKAGRKKVLDTAASMLAEKEKKLRETEASLEEKRHHYDRESHEKAKAACETLSREISSFVARIDANVRRINAINQDIEQILQEQARIEAIKKTQEAEREYLRFVDQSRNILKSAGPEIVKVYIDYISREATSMYCEIAGDRRVEISWTSDYDIVMIEEGRQRTFRQLSGGEQMSAALAVRLAILKILTSSDVVFLDEPTQNMDESRRQNLAQEILRIKGFKQMVVISHDDTFNANLENVVEIEKVNGESCVRGRTLAGP